MLKSLALDCRSAKFVFDVYIHCEDIIYSSTRKITMKQEP